LAVAANSSFRLNSVCILRYDVALTYISSHTHKATDPRLSHKSLQTGNLSQYIVSELIPNTL